jgi:hypothetical protein
MHGSDRSHVPPLRELHDHPVRLPRDEQDTLFCAGGLDPIAQTACGCAWFGDDLASFGARSVLIGAVRAERRATLLEGTDETVARALFGALPQVAGIKPTDLARRVFTLTPVTNLDGQESSYYPTALISRIHPGLEEERTCLAHSDGLGCAVHADPWLARRNAAYEFLNRQHLVAAWLGQVLTELDLSGREDGPEDGPEFSAAPRLSAPALSIISDLRGAGALRIFVLTEPGRGYFCLALFQGNFRGALRHAFGSSYRQAPERALQRALEALWQAWLGQNGFAAEEHLPRSSLVPSAGPRGFCDRLGGFPCWSRDWGPRQGLLEFLALPEVIADDALVCLRNRSNSLRLFSATSSGQTVVRILGPDFYLHSEPAATLNYDNGFARRWAYQAARIYRAAKRPGPFG